MLREVGANGAGQRIYLKVGDSIEGICSVPGIRGAQAWNIEMARSVPMMEFKTVV
jgi:hypothetical protein